MRGSRNQSLQIRPAHCRELCFCIVPKGRKNSNSPIRSFCAALFWYLCGDYARSARSNQHIILYSNTSNRSPGVERFPSYAVAETLTLRRIIKDCGDKVDSRLHRHQEVFFQWKIYSHAHTAARLNFVASRGMSANIAHPESRHVTDAVRKE